MMKITWYGQACFEIVSSEGTVIYTDPYDPDKAGFKPFASQADIVSKSSSNDDFHDNDHLVPKKINATVIDALEVSLQGGSLESHGITFETIEAMEHSQHPSGHPDQNAMYKFSVDGISIGHMGDMGNDFSDDQLDFFMDIDILLSHAGGFPVISLDELSRIVGITKPRLVIPMHFRTLCYKPKNMYFITECLKYFPEDIVDFASSSTVELQKKDLPEKTRMLVLAYV